MKMVDTRKEALRAGAISGVRVNRTGRRTYTPEYKLDVMRQCDGTGISVAAVALAHGINANLMRRWIVHLQRAVTASTARPQATMLPVMVQAA